MINKFFESLKKKNKSSLSSNNMLDMLRNYFNLRVQAKLGKLNQLHLLKKTRRQIASIKQIFASNMNSDNNRKK